jgi:hypothetical protein
MGYACPVCGDPQADGEHLANHLAFTAMLGDADHEDWLDEHAPEWADTDPAELAGRVTDHADEREFPQVFEDTTDGHDHDGHSHDGHGHGHDHEGGLGHGGGSGLDRGLAPGGVADPTEVFDDADDESAPSDVLAEARELTEERRTNVDTEDEPESAGGDEDAAAGDDGDADDEPDTGDGDAT